MRVHREMRRRGAETAKHGDDGGTAVVLPEIPGIAVARPAPDRAFGEQRAKGVKVGGITLGERGLVWYEGDSAPEWMAALAVPHEKVIDTNGAGDVFHGAYMYSAMANPETSWAEHFDFARSASAHAIQHLGNERSIPSLDDIAASRATFLDVA